MYSFCIVKAMIVRWPQDCKDPRVTVVSSPSKTFFGYIGRMLCGPATGTHVSAAMKPRNDVHINRDFQARSHDGSRVPTMIATPQVNY